MINSISNCSSMYCKYIYGVKSNEKIKENNEYSYGKGGEVMVTIYYVDWCPYSKKALEVWEVVKIVIMIQLQKMGKHLN